MGARIRVTNARPPRTLYPAPRYGWERVLVAVLALSVVVCLVTGHPFLAVLLTGLAVPFLLPGDR